MIMKTKIITEAAICIAIGTILTFIQIPGPWVNGGSITLLSSIPVCLFAYKNGLKWGLMAGVTFGVLQAIIGVGSLKGITMFTFFMAIALDYLLAYSTFALASLFNKMKSKTLGFTLGCFIALLFRFIVHFLSGFLIWGSLTESGLAAITFSFTYNISYMGPEIISTVIGATLVANILKVNKKQNII
ncbi:MAG: energy-coupled thiamine transporter ThiT [Oscillospiraceae bacterium]